MPPVRGIRADCPVLAFFGSKRRRRREMRMTRGVITNDRNKAEPAAMLWNLSMVHSRFEGGTHAGPCYCHGFFGGKAYFPSRPRAQAVPCGARVVSCGRGAYSARVLRRRRGGRACTGAARAAKADHSIAGKPGGKGDRCAEGVSGGLQASSYAHAQNSLERLECQ